MCIYMRIYIVLNIGVLLPFHFAVQVPLILFKFQMPRPNTVIRYAFLFVAVISSAAVHGQGQNFGDFFQDFDYSDFGNFRRAQAALPQQPRPVQQTRQPAQQNPLQQFQQQPVNTQQPIVNDAAARRQQPGRGEALPEEPKREAPKTVAILKQIDE